MQRTARGLLVEIVLCFAGILIACAAFHAAYIHFYKAAYPIGYSDSVMAYSRAYEVPPALVYAVIRTESGFRTDVESSKDARGLMQVTEETFEWAMFRIRDGRGTTYEDLFQSDTNIRYGTAILALHLEQFGTLENALCAYHAGAGNVGRWLDDKSYSLDGKQLDTIPFGDTRRYVEKVKRTQRIYEKLYGLEDWDL